ncbi:MAG: hypothetical protein LBF59_06640, partial [Prevotellaceae bacterium]|nr:hypothetical protein [Prevotellaceae bacterium]
MMKNIRNILILFVALALSATIVAQAQDGETKPSLVVFVVGMESNETGDFLAILIGNELSGGSFEVITRTDVVQKKLRELREYEQSGNVNE